MSSAYLPISAVVGRWVRLRPMWLAVPTVVGTRVLLPARLVPGSSYTITIDEKLVDRAVMRVLRQKCELGLLDPGWAPAERFPKPSACR